MVFTFCVMLQLDPFLDKIFVMKWVKIFGKSRSGFGQFQSARVEDPNRRLQEGQMSTRSYKYTTIQGPNFLESSKSAWPSTILLIPWERHGDTLMAP